MNILFITSRFPFPTLKGDKIRAYYPIKIFSKDHNIDLISFSEEVINESDIEEMKKYCRKINIVKRNKNIFNLFVMLGILTFRPSQMICYKSRKMKEIIKNNVDVGNYDIVHIVCGRLAEYGRYIKKIPTIIDWIDSFGLSTERIFRAEKSRLKKLVYYWEWKKVKKFEEKYIKNYKYAFITSPVDKEYIQSEGDLEIIPNGIDTKKFCCKNSIKNIDLIFTGNMGYFPNIKAVEFFCEKILPEVIKKYPLVTFYVVGTEPSKKVLKYHDGKNVFVTGFIDDINEILNKCKIYVAPLTAGAGIQNKILEAMACRLPVISTSYGNYGIQAMDGVEIIVKNEPKDFAAAVNDLLDNSKEREKIGRNGFNFVENNFSWEKRTKSLFDLYLKSIEGRCAKTS